MLCVFYFNFFKWQEDRHKRKVCWQGAFLLLPALNTDVMPGAAMVILPP